MKSTDTNGYEAFLKIKDKFAASLEASILATLQEMGDDVREITWFSSKSKGNNAFPITADDR